MRNRSVAFYIRLSEADEEVRSGEKCESNSITVQRELLYSFISKSDEYREASVYEYFDDGFTGSRFANRKNFQQMLEDAGKGKFECILVKDFSRLGRDYIEVGNYMEFVFPTMGIRFISVNDGYDSAKMQGMTGGMDVAFKNLIHQMYSRDMSKKCLSARKTRNQRGEYTATYVPYGYKRAPDDKHKLIIDEEVAPFIREIYDRYLAGDRVVDIVKDFNNRKVPTRLNSQQQKCRYKSSRALGDDLWDASEIYEILNHEIYKGTLIQNKWGTEGFGDSKVPIKKSRDEWTIVEGVIPSIISKEQFEKVRHKLSEHRGGKPQGKNTNPPNLFRCGYCGRALAKGSKGKLLYCTMRSRGGDERCRLSRIHTSKVQEMVLEVVKEHVALLVEKVEVAKIQSTSSETHISKDELAEQKNILESTSINLYKDFKAGKVSKAGYDTKRAEIKEQIMSLEKRIEEVEDNQEATKCETTVENLPIIGDEYDSEVMCKLIEKVEVFAEERINVVFKSSDPFRM